MFNSINKFYRRKLQLSSLPFKSGTRISRLLHETAVLNIPPTSAVSRQRNDMLTENHFIYRPRRRQKSFKRLEKATESKSDLTLVSCFSVPSGLIFASEMLVQFLEVLNLRNLNLRSTCMNFTVSVIYKLDKFC